MTRRHDSHRRRRHAFAEPLEPRRLLAADVPGVWGDVEVRFDRDQADSAVVLASGVPSAPTTPDLFSSSDSGASPFDNITRDTTPTFSFRGMAGGIGTLYANGVKVGEDQSSAPDGTYVATSKTLTDGFYDFTATVTDIFGATGPHSSALRVRIDTIGFASSPRLGASSDTGRSNSDRVTADSTPRFSGGGDEGDEITYYMNEQALGTVTVGASGSYAFSITSPLSDGEYKFTATSVDLAGNASSMSTPEVVTIDTVAPTRPFAPNMLSSSDSGRSNSDNITNIRTPNFNGTIEPHARAHLILDGVEFFHDDTGVTGNWSGSTNSLSGGTHTYAVRASDLAGNTSSQSPNLTFVIDTVAPGSPYQPVLHPDSDLGASNSDGITSDASPVVIGRHDSQDILLEMLVNDVPAASGVVDPSTRMVDIQLPPLPDGTHAIRARGYDVAGNGGTITTPLSITIDQTAPAVTGSVFEFETAPHRVRVTFSEDVSASLQASDLVVTRVNGGTGPASSVVRWSPATNVATFEFATPVPDGKYLATLPASSLADVAGNNLAADHVLEFFALAGDANRDQTVNDADYAIFAANFGTSPRTFSQGDFSLDTVVNAADRAILYARFGKTLLSPPGSMRGMVFNDLDANGRFDAGEPPLSGRTVYLDITGNGAHDLGEPTRTSDATGGYSFDELGPGRYAVRQVLPSGWEQTVPLTPGHSINLALGQITTARDFASVNRAAAPQVTGVFVAGTAWTQSFRTHLQSQSLGDATYGYAVDAAGQLNDLPWINLNTVSVRFGTDVNVVQNNLTATGVAVAAYPISGFAYDATTFTATWTLASVVSNEKLAVTLSGVTDATTDVALDGEWPGTVAAAFPSGDGSAGGDFRFRLDVLPANIDGAGAVNIADFGRLRAGFGQPLTATSIFADLDGSGGINISDFGVLRQRFGQGLPAGEPA